MKSTTTTAGVTLRISEARGKFERPGPNLEYAKFREVQYRSKERDPPSYGD